MICNWGTDWNWDNDLQEYHTNLNKSANGILISSQMTQGGFNAHWKQVMQNPKDKRFEFASHIVDTKKIVVSRKFNLRKPKFPVVGRTYPLNNVGIVAKPLDSRLQTV